MISADVIKNILGDEEVEAVSRVDRVSYHSAKDADLINISPKSNPYKVEHDLNLLLTKNRLYLIGYGYRVDLNKRSIHKIE